MADITVRALLEVLLKGQNLPKELREDLERLRAQAKRTEGGIGLMEQGIRKLVGLAAGLFGLGKAVQFIRNSFTGFAREERTWRGIATQIEALGGNVDEARAKIGQLSNQTKILDDHLIPAFGRLLRATDDVAAAQGFLDVAAKFASNGIGNIEENAEALARALQTGTTRSLVQFGIKAEEGAEKGVKLADAMQQVFQRADQFSLSVDDAQRQADGLAKTLDDLGDAVGSVTSDLITLAQKNLDTPILFRGIALAAGEAANKLHKVAEAAKAAEDQSPRAEAFGPSTEELTRMKAAFDTQAAAREAVAKRQAALDRAAAEERAKTAREAAEKAAAAEREAEIEAAGDRARFDADTTDAIWRNRIEAAEKGSDERYRLESDNLERLREREVANAFAANGDINAVNQLFLEQQLTLFSDYLNAKLEKIKEADEEAKRQELESAEELRNARLDLIGSYGEEALALELEQLDAELAEKLARYEGNEEARANIEAAYAVRRAAVRQKHVKGELTLEKQKVAAQRQLLLGYTADILGNLSRAFGGNKALAIASALVSTYQGVAAALTPPPTGYGPTPAGYAAAAAALTFGLAQVQAIRSTNLGSSGGGGGGGGRGGGAKQNVQGGPIPSLPATTHLKQPKPRAVFDEDAAALGGGDRPVRASEGGTTIDNRVNVEIRGTVIDNRHAARRLERTLARERRRDNDGPRRLR